MTDKPSPQLIERSGIRRITPREAYENGASVAALKKWFHLSDSEVQDVAPEEFENRDAGQNGVSGY